MSYVYIIVAFVIGFIIGRRSMAKKPTQFTDHELALEAGEKGRASVQARIERRKAKILERAQREGRITNDDVEDLFCIADSTARLYLKELEEEGKLTQHGEQGRGTYYTPTELTGL